MTPTNLEKARAAWGTPLLDWVRTLAEACDRDNQRVVGERLGLSSGVVSRLIGRTYTAGYDEMRIRVLSTLGDARVMCPVVEAEIAMRTCVANRRRKLVPTNWLAGAFARTCPVCRKNTDRSQKSNTDKQED